MSKNSGILQMRSLHFSEHAYKKSHQNTKHNLLFGGDTSSRERPSATPARAPVSPPRARQSPTARAPVPLPPARASARPDAPDCHPARAPVSPQGAR